MKLVSWDRVEVLQVFDIVLLRIRSSVAPFQIELEISANPYQKDASDKNRSVGAICDLRQIAYHCLFNSMPLGESPPPSLRPDDLSRTR